MGTIYTLHNAYAISSWPCARAQVLVRESQQVASGILQTNINFKDIKDRINQIKVLVEELAQNNG